MTLALGACGRSDLYDEPAGVVVQRRDPIEGTVRLRVDDFFTLFVNGVQVKDESARLWSDVKQEAAVSLVCGRNVLAIDARNRWRVDGLDRGAILDLTYGTAHVVTDSSWRVGSGRDWADPKSDDSAWPAAVEIARHGGSPWGAVLGVSEAKWIWSFDPSGGASTKVEAETVGLRKTFFVACP